jgi:hypothetical protein
VDCLRHLDTDRPATEYQQSARHSIHPGHLAVRPEPPELAQARDGRDHGIGTVGENDVVGAVANAVYVDEAWAGQSAGAAK